MEKDLLTGVLTKTLNKSPEEISELLYEKTDDSDEVTLKEGALDLVLDLDQQRVERLKTSTKPNKDDLKSVRDRTIKETMEDFEKKVKAKYGIQSSLLGLDLVQEIIDQVSECDISDEKVKSHPLYLELESLKSKEDFEALQTEFNDFKLNQDRIARFSQVKSNVLSIFSKLNPIESQNTRVAQNRRNDLLKKFDPFDFELKEDGNHLILRDGNRVEDKHGNPVKFDDFVKDVVSDNYDLAKGDPKGSSGNEGAAGAGGDVTIPKDEKEYLALMADLKLKGDTDGFIKLGQAWNASQTK